MATAATQTSDTSFNDELPTGTELLLGQYKITSYLNHGGFGITYLANDSLQRQVVVKECFPGTLCRRSRLTVQARSRAHVKELASVVRLFLREAQALSKLDHPNIVGVHQVFEDHGTAYMVLDYIEGADLLSHIEDAQPRLSPDQVRTILLRLLDAIGFVHRAGMLHRDISPDNIILTKALDPKLIDFGAAREQATQATQALSALRVVKDGYSPQEFYLVGSEQGPSSDLYSLAATFYHLITGAAPPDSQIRITAHVAGDPDPYVPLAQRTSDYDPAFCDALDKALAVLPKDRLQSAEAWTHALAQPAAPPAPNRSRRLAPVAPRRASKPTIVLPKPAPVAKRRARRPVRLSAIALAVAAGGVLLAGGYYDTASQGPDAAADATPRVAVDAVMPTTTGALAAAGPVATQAAAPTAPRPPVSSVPAGPPMQIRTEWAGGQITLSAALDLPFEVTGDGRLVNISPDLAATLAGTRLHSVDGMTIDPGGDFAGFLADLAQATPDTGRTLVLGFRDPETGAAQRTSLTVDLVYRTAFLNGLRADTRARDGGWVTTVTALPEAQTSAVQLGDELVALLDRNARIDEPTSFAETAAATLAEGAARAEFAVRRGEAIWVVEVPLAATAE